MKPASTKAILQKKTILLLDNLRDLEQSIRAPLALSLEKSGIASILVRAKDGAEAAMKSEKQKFDMILIDTDIPRLMEGGFIYGINDYKNTQEADLVVFSEKSRDHLPDSLREGHFLSKPLSTAELIDTVVTIINVQDNVELMTTQPEVKKYAVDVRVINAVIKATINVLSKFGVSSISMHKAEYRSPAEPLMGSVSSVIDIKSKSFLGLLTVSFDKNSFLEVTSNMLMEEQTDLTDENQDAVGEINNIIFGNAKAEMSNYGMEMTLPKVLLGPNQVIPCPEGSAGMMIAFSTQRGRFYLSVIALPLPN